ncbi:MAG: hypothetical protein ABEJ24_01465 [Candidatus Magasanikbacteria bacterium]
MSNEQRRVVSLDEVRETLADEFGEKVLIDLIPQIDESQWVLDLWAELDGAQPHDEWVAGRRDRRFFDVGVRNPYLDPPQGAPWGQLEIREEPTIQPDQSGNRIVGYVLIESLRLEYGSAVRVTASSVSNDEAEICVDDQPAIESEDEVHGMFRTNGPRINGDVLVIERPVESAEGDGWGTPNALIKQAEDQKVGQGLRQAGLVE